LCGRKGGQNERNSKAGNSEGNKQAGEQVRLFDAKRNESKHRTIAMFYHDCCANLYLMADKVFGLKASDFKGGKI
jgi:hypothetical protein